MNVATAISAGATAAIVKAITGTVVSEGVIMTYHNGWRTCSQAGGTTSTREDRRQLGRDHGTITLEHTTDHFAAQRLGGIDVLVSSIAQKGMDQTKSAEMAPGTTLSPTDGSAAGAHGPPIFVVQYHSP